MKHLLRKLQILKALKYISFIGKTLQSDNGFVLWLLMSYCTVSCLQVQLQWQDKTGFRLDLGKAVGVKSSKAFGPLLWGLLLEVHLSGVFWHLNRLHQAMQTSACKLILLSSLFSPTVFSWVWFPYSEENIYIWLEKNQIPRSICLSPLTTKKIWGD